MIAISREGSSDDDVHHELNGVQGIKELVDSGIVAPDKPVPAKYIRPPSDRPCLDSQQEAQASDLPIINLSGLQGRDRQKTVEEIGQACEQWGFFQVVDHGVSPEVCERMWRAARAFFDQPAQERMRWFSTDFSEPVAYCTSFNPAKETVLEWKDSLFLRRGPDYGFDGLQHAPLVVRDPILEYMDGVRALAHILWKAILEGLDVDIELTTSELPNMEKEVVGLLYYAPCPCPRLTLGLSSHSDIGVLTILMQDEVPGLQILNNESWLTVKPLPNSFVVNVGDQLEILTNGKYKSVEHRVITNLDIARMSIPFFFQPRNNAKVSPLTKLVSDNSPSLYKEIIYGDYTRNVYSKVLKGKSNLDFAKLLR